MRTLQLYKEFVKGFYPRIPEPLLQDVVAIDKALYFDPQQLMTFAQAHDIKAHSVGQFLGTAEKTFQPSPFCIERMSAFAKKKEKALLDEKGSWLFLCGRDVFGEQVLEGTPEYNKPVFVFDKNSNHLGCGNWVVQALDVKFKERVVLKHMHDRGAYIPRKEE